jgi:hypothetical protein
MTHDDKRHGTTTVFAALDVATGKVIVETAPSSGMAQVSAPHRR